MKNSETLPQINAKIIMVGNSTVGKTSILIRLTENTFLPVQTTLGIDYKVKTLEVDGTKMKLQVWDTAGQERFKTIVENFFKGSLGAIFVFDLTNKSSFEGIRTWITQCLAKGPERLQKILVGNKADLIEQKAVTDQEISVLADEYDLKYFEVSASSGVNVIKAFTEIARQIKETFFAEDLRKSGRISLSKSGIEQKKPENSKCCK